MKVLRNIEQEVEQFEIGDQIALHLESIGDFTATAQKVTDQGTLFFFDTCLNDRAMNEENSNRSGFAESDLCRWMNEELLDAFPDDIRKNLVPLEGGNLLTVPTVGEMFGGSDFFENDGNEQLPLMKSRKNRICYDQNDDWCWYWLQNRRKGSSAGFASVYGGGSLNYTDASATFELRPRFLLGDLESGPLVGASQK